MSDRRTPDTLTDEQREALADIGRRVGTAITEAMRGIERFAAELAAAFAPLHERQGHAWQLVRPVGHLIAYRRCYVCKRWHPTAPAMLPRTKTTRTSYSGQPIR